MTNDNIGFGPEDLVRIGRSARDKLPGSLPLVGAVVVGALVLIGLFSSYYQVEPDEVGLVTRFGRFIRTANPGLHAKILERASQVVPDYGIELVDLQIQRLNYIDSVQAKVFERMISERKRIADRFRSEGQGKSAEIRGKKERELKVIESEAYRKTQDIMGRGDAEATAIYADAYNRNRELYEFSKTMDTYRKGIDKDSWLVLSTNARLFRYLQSPDSDARGGSPHR